MAHQTFLQVAGVAVLHLLLVAGCFPLRPEEARVQRIWPPEGDDLGQHLSDSRRSGTSASQQPSSDSPSTGSKRSAASPSKPADQDDIRAPQDNNVTAPLVTSGMITDARLTADQQQQLNAQLNTMAVPLGYPPVSPDIVRDAAQPPTSEVSLASYISEDHSADQQAKPEPTATPPAAPAAKPTDTAAESKTNESAAVAPAATPAAAESANVTKEVAPAASSASNASEQNGAAAATSDTSPAPAASPPATADPPAAANSAIDPPASSASNPDSEAGAHRNWREDLQHAVVGLEQQLQEESLSADERMRLEATLRLLYVADNRREEAAKPITSLNTDQQEFWKFSLAGFLALLDPHGPPIDDRRAKLALRHFREAIYHLGAASSLDVRNLAICRRVDSFGSYTEFETYEFKPEQEVILYVEVGNFAVEQKPDGYETELQGSYQILDGTGRRIADYDLLLDKQICRSIRTDYFFPYVIALPKDLAAGAYRIQVTIEDKKRKKFGQTPPVEFTIR